MALPQISFVSDIYKLQAQWRTGYFLLIGTDSRPWSHLFGLYDPDQGRQYPLLLLICLRTGRFQYKPGYPLKRRYSILGKWTVTSQCKKKMKQCTKRDFWELERKYIYCSGYWFVANGALIFTFYVLSTSMFPLGRIRYAYIIPVLWSKPHNQGRADHSISSSGCNNGLGPCEHSEHLVSWILDFLKAHALSWGNKNADSLRMYWMSCWNQV